MAAANTDKFKKAKRRFSTTIGVGGFTAGATTLPLTSTSGLDTDTAITLVIEPGSINEEVITGVVSGSNVINCVRGKEGTTDATHVAGSAVSMYFTETHWDDLINGILVEHKQDGTHGTLTSTSISTGAITATTVSGTTGTFSGNVSDNGQTLQTIRSEQIKDFVASGCVWTADNPTTNNVASMTAGTLYIGGKRVTVSAVTSRTFTASKDTYVDIDNTGTITYTEVANNAASPTLAANSIRIAILCTTATKFSNQYAINQGFITSTSNNYKPNGLTAWNGNPSSSVITDSYGNRIYNRDPQGKLVSAYSRTGSATSGAPGGTSVAWNGMNYVSFIAEANTNYKLTFQEGAISGHTGSGELIFEFYLASAYNTYTTRVGDHDWYIPASANSPSGTIMFNSGSYSGLTYLNIKVRSTGWSGTMTMNTDSTRTGVYIVEKV